MRCCMSCHGTTADIHTDMASILTDAQHNEPDSNQNTAKTENDWFG